MLSIPAKNWADRVKVDRTNPKHFYNGRTYSFDEIAGVRAAENLQAQCAPEEAEKRHACCRRAIDCLADAYESVKPDAAVVVGNDQMEVFTSEHVPAFAVFWGPYVEGIPRTPEFLAKLPPGIPQAELDRTPSVYTQYPCLPELGEHVIGAAMAEGFDVAQIKKLSTGEIGSNAAPHAYGFVYRRVLRDRVVPHVPVFVNTFYPPNQPRAARCWEFGRMLARAIASWPEDQTVVVIASGGLSHFVVNESFDHQALDAMQRADSSALAAIPEDMFQSGTSEIKNWITVAGAMAEAGLKMKLVDYVPCYRSEAGTGSGMGFARWD